MSGAHRQSPDTFRQDAAILGHWGSGQPRGRAAFPDDGEPRGRVKADDSLSAFNDCYLEGVGGASRFSRPAPDSEAVERRGASSTRHPTVARCARKTFRGGQKNAACLSLACDVGYSRFFWSFSEQMGRPSWSAVPRTLEFPGGGGRLKRRETRQI